MTLSKLSKKQKLILKWCHMPSTRDKYNTIICDGAVRSGKTVAMIEGFIFWAMRNFNQCNFGICGKTVQSTERNIIMVMQQMVDITKFFQLSYIRSTHLMTIKYGNNTNYFYVFGGKDESSYQLIQGITLAGVLFDEVALMPESFVNQAIARTLSVSNAKLWFNCNPDNPNHWFNKNWIIPTDKGNKPNILHLHFLMNDNPILSPNDIEKAEKLYTGAFRNRYILGLWVAAEGLIYDMFSPAIHVSSTVERKYIEYMLSCDYGTQNATAIGLWGYADKTWHLTKEYYYSGRDKNKQKTDEQYYQDLVQFVGDIPAHSIIVDPSAASFIATIRIHNKFVVIPATNSVVDGIRFTASLFQNNKIFINDCCTNTIQEIQAYRWDEKAKEDAPIKENDHACDMIRYFCYTHIRRNAYKYGINLLGGKKE